ncbi:hypothetical protein [Phorcysia thermohydrogeniphila]|uniref:Transglycosylase-like protein with SLT domain n=1 Tax=Phorcysia thermohydrogeniphila TaxID=936138 RepID=A0A4R1GH62_9BACT|nr:hypothetical protein [Phorcysia thermohydrogeniphila]TCK06351.1 hypothetical protein CLV27_0152 [Phorcysia thermohydrogeniphila]
MKLKTLLPIAGVAILVLATRAHAHTGGGSSPSSADSLSPQWRELLKQQIDKVAFEQRVPAEVLWGICMTESGCSREYLRSMHPDGKSFGLFGLTNGALQDALNEYNPLPGFRRTIDKVSDERAIYLQAEAAAKYLHALRTKYGHPYRIHTLFDAIQAYHVGPTAYRWGRRAPGYLDKVLAYAKTF